MIYFAARKCHLAVANLNGEPPKVQRVIRVAYRRERLITELVQRFGMTRRQAERYIRAEQRKKVEKK